MALLVAFAMSMAPALETVLVRQPVISREQAARLLGARRRGGNLGERSVLRLDATGQVRLITARALAKLAGFPPPQNRLVFGLSYRPNWQQRRCLATARAIARRDILKPGDVVAAPCGEAASGLLTYDRDARAIVATAAIPSHVRIGDWMIARRPSVNRGQVLAVRSSVGPVVIEGQVTALQLGEVGRPVFVRGVTGPAFALPLSEAAR